MNTDLILAIDSISSDATEQLGSKLGQKLRGGEVIELVSDLGGGKTTFVRGLAAGTGSTDRVASPTFTISKVYKTPNFEIHHFDFYRLPEAGLIEHELEDVLHDPKVVVIVEWGEVVKHVLSEKRLTIHIKQSGEESRTLELSYPKELHYLVEAL